MNPEMKAATGKIMDLQGTGSDLSFDYLLPHIEGKVDVKVYQ